MKAIITLVLVLTTSAAKDLDVYVYNANEYYVNQTKAGRESSPSFKFGYHSADVLYMQIFLKNEALNVSSEVYLKYSSGSKLKKEKFPIYITAKKEKYVQISRDLNYSKILIELVVSTTSGICFTKQIVEAESVIGTPDKGNGTPYNDICLKKKQWCVIVVDLLNNECEVPESTNSQPTHQNSSILIYVIPSLTVMCVIIVASYIIVKKYCLRKSHLVCTTETLELDTYATTNEIVYADLSLVQGDRQPPRREEESPYAEIIGVLNPH